MEAHASVLLSFPMLYEQCNYLVSLLMRSLASVFVFAQPLLFYNNHKEILHCTDLVCI